jgi:hypothetical protein
LFPPNLTNPGYATAVAATSPTYHFLHLIQSYLSCCARINSILFPHCFSIFGKQLTAVAADRAVVKLMKSLHKEGVSAATIPTALLDQTFHCRHNRPLIVSLFIDQSLQQVMCGDQCPRMCALSVLYEIR